MVISVGEYFLHMAQARLRRDAGPRSRTRTLLSTQLLITFRLR